MVAFRDLLWGDPAEAVERLLEAGESPEAPGAEALSDHRTESEAPSLPPKERTRRIVPGRAPYHGWRSDGPEEAGEVRAAVVVEEARNAPLPLRPRGPCGEINTRANGSRRRSVNPYGLLGSQGSHTGSHEMDL